MMPVTPTMVMRHRRVGIRRNFVAVAFKVHRRFGHGRRCTAKRFGGVRRSARPGHEEQSEKAQEGQQAAHLIYR